MVWLLDKKTAEQTIKRVEDVGVGRVVVTRQKIVLRAMALGSCIGAAAYDHSRRIGGIAHIMLPGNAPDKAAEKTRYAANAIDRILGQMMEMGSILSDVQVCLVGAGNVLRRDDDTICRSNVDSVQRILENRGIDVKASALGGTQRRSVSLDIESGDICYTEGNGGKTLLWKAGMGA